MIAAIIQARMGSSRLPGKVMLKAAGKTFLEHLAERLEAANTLDRVLIATSTLAGDDAIAKLCKQNGIDCYRGSETDVLDRYYRAALAVRADTIVRITADCPLTDPEIVDRFVGFQQANRDAYDLVTNRHPLTFPDGLDVDVMPFQSLETAWRNATTPFQREHVIPYFWEAGLRVHNIEHPDNLFLRHRWTVDYEEDARLVATIFEDLSRPGSVFGMNEILAHLEDHQELGGVNAIHLPQAG